jgi:hypothetical protein
MSKPEIHRQFSRVATLGGFVLAVFAAVLSATSHADPSNEQPNSRMAVVNGTVHKGFGLIKLAERSAVCGVDGKDSEALVSASIEPGRRTLCVRAAALPLNSYAASANDRKIVVDLRAGETYFLQFKNKFTRYEFWLTDESGGVVEAATSPLPAEAPHTLPPLTPASTAPPPVNWLEPGNFDALREAFGQRADFAARCEDDRPAKRFMTLVEAKQFHQAAQVTLEWLDRCPVDASIHSWTAAALKEAGDEVGAQAHWKWFEGITDSAMANGDGKTPDTAFTTISISEEDAVLTRLGLTKTGQALLRGERMIDSIEAEDESGKTQTVYFYPHWHFIRLAHLVRGAAPRAQEIQTPP